MCFRFLKGLEIFLSVAHGLLLLANFLQKFLPDSHFLVYETITATPLQGEGEFIVLTNESKKMHTVSVSPTIQPGNMMR
jgi:hypothetical protein